MSKNSSSSSRGTGTLSLLGIVFIVLKLTGNITWSWWWVTAPFWGGLAVFLAALIIIGLIAIISSK